MIEQLTKMFDRFTRVRPNGRHVDLAASNAIAIDSARPAPGNALTQQFDLEKTLGQVSELLGVFNPRLVGFDTLNCMRQDPDVALGFGLLRAPIINMNWTVESDDPKIKALVDCQMKRHYRQLATGATLAMGFGWQALEKVWKVEDTEIESTDSEGKTSKLNLPNAFVYKRFKALDQRSVGILIDKEEDDWAGLEQQTNRFSSTAPVKIGRDRSVLWSFRREEVWGNLRGFPMFWQAYEPWWFKGATNLFTNRFFERKGDPPWKARSGGEVKGSDKVSMDGGVYMQQQMLGLRSSGIINLPSTKDKDGDFIFDVDTFKLENRGDMFQNRLAWLSTQILRALWITDRAGTAGGGGGIGTGESEEHKDSMLMMFETILNEWVDCVLNPQVIEPLVLFNFGPEAVKNCKTRVRAGGISRSLQTLMTDLLKQLLQAESTLMNGGTLSVGEMINVRQMAQSLNVPLRPEEELEEMAEKKEERRREAAASIGREDGGEVDDEKVAGQLEDEGVLGRGTAPTEEEFAAVELAALRITPTPSPTNDLLAQGRAVADLTRSVAAWEIPRASAVEQLVQMGMERDKVELALGEAGKGPKPEPPVPPPAFVVNLPAMPEPAQPIILNQLGNQEIRIPDIKNPPPEVPKELITALEQMGKLPEMLAATKGEPVNPEDFEYVVERGSDMRMTRVRVERKKK